MKAKLTFYLALVIAGSALLGVGEFFTIAGMILTALGLFLLLLEAIRSNRKTAPVQKTTDTLHPQPEEEQRQRQRRIAARQGGGIAAPSACQKSPFGLF